MRISTTLATTLLATAFSCLLSVGAQAATYVVNTTDVDLPDTNTALAGCDANPMQAGDQCTLRAAVMQANAGAGADTIVLPLGAAITLTIPGDGDASVGDLNITAPVVITSIVLGAPANANSYPTITSNGSDRIFRVDNNAHVELRGMQLIDGVPPGLEFGGALATLAGTQTLVDRVRFRENYAYAGGAIANWGVLTVEDSDFLLNVSGAAGAALYNDGIATIRRSSIRRSRVTQSNHSAIYTEADSLLTVENTLIDGNDSGVGSTDTAGIHAVNPAALIVRNSTLVDFTGPALHLSANDDSTVRVFNSVLVGSGSDDCRIDVAGGSSPDIIVDYSLLPVDSDCLNYEDHYNVEVYDSAYADLASMANNLDSFVQFRQPLLNSPLIDLGKPDGVSGEPGLECIAEDQIGNMRPQDGNGNGGARCDIGAIEAANQNSSSYTVNWYSQDLPDANPGDDVCDADLTSEGTQCTLRAAVMEANAKPGPDFITFEPHDSPADNTLVLTRSGAGGALWGDLDITEQVMITGNLQNGRPVTQIVGAMSDRLFDVSLPAGHFASFLNMKLTGGTTTGYGGAVRAMSAQLVYLHTMELVTNSATLGGGALYSQAQGLTVVRTDLHHNTAPTDGAAILARGHLYLVSSSLWNNTTADAGQGEVIYIDDNGSYDHAISNVTMSGNSGGILADQVNHLLIRFATIVDNDDYGLRATNSGTVQIFSSILSGNQHADCSMAAGITLGADHYNLIDDASCAPGGTNTSVSPQLMPALWQPDYRVTRVRRPQPGSPVIDAIPVGIDANDACPPDSFDQIRRDRPMDSDGDGVDACDIGSVELFDGEADPAEFVVNVFDTDKVDSNPGDGVCDIYPATTGQQCTLRAAIMESNLQSGHNHVSFSSSGAEVVVTRAAGGAANDATTGDLDILDGITIEGFSSSPAARPHVTASNSDRIFNINAAGDSVSMSDLILSGGSTTGSGGAIRIVNVDSADLLRVRMDANTSGQGGGALSALSGTITLDRVDMDNNATVGNGSAIRNQTELTILRSSIRDNLDFDAVSERQAIHASNGGYTGIYNSTLSGNSGVAVDVTDGTLQMENSTIADNSGWGARFQKVGGETLFLRHDLFSQNGSGGCQANGAGAAMISTNGYNISQSYGCDIQSGASNLVTADVNLVPLATLPTSYSAFHLLGPGSQAIDFGSLIAGGAAGCETHDQDNIPRPIDGDGDGSARCDVGAVEMAQWSGELFSDSFED